ncbi:amino acid adenylation domain-containing protein [Wukongibacter sp. M2B1]|uniref:amino acid adenylation domain-containing protein n=1 Tax=Wukongibacter sp. M2B1 TaxID=3088895 RepID=UPI003D7A532E
MYGNDHSQNVILASGKFEAEKEFWLKKLQGDTVMSGLPIEYQRISLEKFKKGIANYKFSDDLLQEMIAISGESKYALFIVLLTGVKCILSKYIDSKDITVGMPVFKQKREGVFLNNILALKSEVKNSETFKTLLLKVKNTVTQANNYQNYPYDKIAKQLNLQFEDEKLPLINTVVLLDDIHNRNNIDWIKADTVFSFSIRGGSLEVNVEYNSNLYNEKTIHRAIVHINNFLSLAIKKPNIQLRNIDILPSSDKAWILNNYNNTETEYQNDLSLHKLFEKQVEKTPDNKAVVFDDISLTYRELNEKSNQIANFLKEQGLQDNELVGVLACRSIYTIANILGILKAGGAYVPIDPSYPEERRSYILSNSECRMLLEPELYLSNGISNYCKENISENNLMENIAYVIYTSGSTGRPKGVVITHKAVVNTIIDINRKFDISEKDNIIGISSLCFDLSVYDVFGALSTGATLTLIKDQRDAKELFNTIQNQEITFWNSVPAIMDMLIENINDDFKNTNLRLVFLSGDWIPIKLPEKIKKHFPNAQIISFGGATEASIWSIYYPINVVKKTWRSIPYGKPLANQRFYVLDREMQLCPIGIQGELYIGGIGLAKGYLNDREKTEKAFITHGELGNLYKTGDFGVLHDEGNIEFLGRKDYQVKIRGYRIELEEIESVLLRLDIVERAIVTDCVDNIGRKCLCAYLVSHEKLSISRLKEFLANKLPDYMIPTYFVQLDNIPLTPNGKVDRKALPHPKEYVDAYENYVAPEDEIEEKLVDIWKELLGIEKVGTTVNFFELGGHSLKASILVSMVHKEFNIEIPLRKIFEKATIKELAEYIRKTEKSILYPAIEPIIEKDYYRVSSSQKRIYIVNQLEGVQTSYNMPGAMLIEGDLNISRLNEVFMELVNRHEGLRTSFKVIDGEIMQIVHKKVDFKVDFIEIDNNFNRNKEILNSDEGRSRVREFIQPFDLSKAPLLRVAILKISENNHILIYDMHHIISDGISMSILVNEFISLYGGKALPELSIHYKDFSEWQNQLFATDIIKRQEAYWLNVLKGEIPLLNMPTDYSRLSEQNFEGSIVCFEIDKELTDKLKIFVSETRSTLFMVLLATYNVLLSKYTGQEDIIIGTPSAGRINADIMNVIGMFVNTLAMRNYPQGIKSFKEFLLEVKDNVIQAFENQNFQFEELLERLNLRRELSRNPLFDTIFAVQNIDMKDMEIPGLKFSQYLFDNPISKFDLSMGATEKEDKIEFTIAYKTKLFKKETMQRLGEHYVNILRKVVENPQIKLSEIDMMSQKEKKILVELNNTKSEDRDNLTVHQLFEERESKVPHNVALIFKEHRLTYREVNEKANQLARILRKKGIKPNCIVSILLDYSLEMVIGILAVLKAGGAFMLIESTYPTYKINNMLIETNTEILLSKSCLVKDVSFNRCVVEVDHIELSREEKSNLENVNIPTDLIYITYNSGRTEPSRGVMVQHLNVMNLLTSLHKEYSLEEKATYLLNTPCTSDVIVTELFSWFFCEGRLVICGENERRDLKYILALIDEHNITHINFVPTVLDALMDTMNRDDIEILRRLKYIFLSGEKILKSLLGKLGALSGAVKIEYLYGAPETTVYSLKYSLNGLGHSKKIPVGRPLNNVKAYILDKNNNKLPSGIPGELYISGLGVAKGYINKGEETKEVFIPNPFYSNEKMFKTGDIAMRLPDGNIEYLGKVSQQYEVSGQRVELEEIEVHLQRHRNIKKAIVTVKKDANGNKKHIAYFVSDDESKDLELKDYLARELPQYMIPSDFIGLKDIPLDSNGRIDIEALPENSSKDDKEDATPINEIQRELLEVWKNVLGIEDISIHDNFFHIGGNSVKVIQVVANLRNYKTHLRDFVRYPTISELSKHMEPVVLDNNQPKLKEEDLRGYSTGFKTTYCENDGTVNILDENILDNIEPFNEVFYRSCFFHALFAAVNYFNRDITPILANEIMSYSYDKDRSGVKLNIQWEQIRNVKEVLEDIGITGIQKIRSNNIMDDVKSAISQNRPAIVYTDCFYESIREDMYKKDHWRHCVLVFGYDESKQTCNVLEHSGINNLDFRECTMSYTDIINSYNGYVVNFQKGDEIPTYFELELANDFSDKYIYDANRYKSIFAHNMLNRKDTILQGLEYLVEFRDDFYEFTSNEETLRTYCSELLFTVNHIMLCKQVERFKLLKLLGHDNAFISYLDEIVDNWRFIRSVILKYFYSSKYKRRSLENLMSNLEKIYEIEKQYNKSLFEFLSIDSINNYNHKDMF